MEKWIFAILLLLFPASKRAPFRVTQPSNGSHVAHSFAVEGRTGPDQRVEVVAEYPASKLPGYEHYHDVVGAWHCLAAPDGLFSIPVGLEQLPSSAPLVLFVHTGTDFPLRIEVWVDR